MTHSALLDYKDAFSYAAAWASSVNVSTSDLTRDQHEFHGTLGSLDFQYSDVDHVLHVWSFVMPGAGPFVTKRPEVKKSLDSIAQQHPDQTAGAVFDIRTLEWNQRATPKLEPCLRLRFDIHDNSVPLQEMVRRLDHLSTTGFNWNRHKMSEVLDAYWKTQPSPGK